jgi:hypothetical protein
MKLGIVVVYLFDANTEYLLDLHIRHIRKFTTSSYTIYGSAARLDPKYREKLCGYPEIELCNISPTDLRGGDEHGYYLEHLTAIAFQKGSTHVVTLHLDSFPVCMGWERTLSAITAQSNGCIAAERIFTACLFFSKDFYERYRPTYKSTEPQYLEFVKKHRFFDHSGTPYLYTCHVKNLPWHLLKNITQKPMTDFGVLCGGLVFHFSAAIRLSPGRGLIEEKPLGKIRSMILISIQAARRIHFLRKMWSSICSLLPKRLSPLLKKWLTDQANSGEVAEKERFRFRLMNHSKSCLFETTSSALHYEQLTHNK